VYPFELPNGHGFQTASMYRPPPLTPGPLGGGETTIFTEQIGDAGDFRL
jgi:hypothetical protein